MIRRINDIIRSLLIHAQLPPMFWVEALHTAAYLYNILPTKRLNFFTPTFALYLRHPTYDHLRVFGCACYPNTSATQPHKLHPCSVRCIFLGYPADFRGYRCFDPTTGKVHISRHVTFDEHTFPYTIPTPPNTYTFLDDATPLGFTFSRLIPTPPNPKPHPHSTSPLPFTYSRRPRPPPTHQVASQPQTEAAMASSQPQTTSVPVPIQPQNQPTAASQPSRTTRPTPPPNTHPMTTRSKAHHTLVSASVSPHTHLL